MAFENRYDLFYESFWGDKEADRALPHMLYNSEIYDPDDEIAALGGNENVININRLWRL